MRLFILIPLIGATILFGWQARRGWDSATPSDMIPSIWYAIGCGVAGILALAELGAVCR